MTQRWLSLDGICTTLTISKPHALWMAKQGILAVIWGKASRRKIDARFLDPTPEYAEKLKLCEALYGRLHPLPIDIDLTPLLSLREIAEITGLELTTLRTMQGTRRLDGGIKVGNYLLYPSSVVRELLWKRTDRKGVTKQRAPFLLEELIRYFMDNQAALAEGVPTDAQLAADDLMQKKIVHMLKLPSPQREAALREFWMKVEMAKQVASALTHVCS